MKKNIIFILVAIMCLIVTVIVLFLSNYRIKNDWKKVNIKNNCYYETTVLKIDLDGDNLKEEINLKMSENYISINDIDYSLNNYSENQNFTANQYCIVDLNEDGLLDIIYKTSSMMILPATNKYTIYNFNNNNLKEIGNISIIGNMPDEIYVKGNIIKFDYWPSGSPRDYTEKIEYELKV